MNKLIEINHLNFSYRDIDGIVLENIQFSLNSGENAVIKGPSGCGKSTLLHLIAGLLSPKSGEILFEGKPLPFEKDQELADYRKKFIGVITQDSQLIPQLNVEENILLSLQLLPQAEISIALDELLTLLGIEKIRKKWPTEISGGERQRVAIARAVIKHPKLILADEPSGSLDEDNSEKLYELMDAIQKKVACSFIIATHDLQFAGNFKNHFSIKRKQLIRDE